jgi:hypothetical protein
MTPQQYVQALNDLQKPLVVQQKRVAAVAKQHGVGSYQYKQEFEKEAKMIVNLYPKEMALLWEFRTACYKEKVKQVGKDAVIAEIIKEGKACIDEYKDGWRSVYQQIKSLP